MQERVTQAIAMIDGELDILSTFEEDLSEAYDNERDNQVDRLEDDIMKHGAEALRRVKHILETGEYPEGTYPGSGHAFADEMRAYREKRGE